MTKAFGGQVVPDHLRELTRERVLFDKDYDDNDNSDDNECLEG